jgi:hypothetical protein
MKTLSLLDLGRYRDMSVKKKHEKKFHNYDLKWIT